MVVMVTVLRKGVALATAALARVAAILLFPALARAASAGALRVVRVEGDALIAVSAVTCVALVGACPKLEAVQTLGQGQYG
jgi:hypothetical protein